MIIDGQTFLENVRRVSGVFLTGMAAYFFPIRDFFTAMLCVFAANFFVGLTADIKSGGHWDNRKAEMFFFHVFIFFGIACFIFIIAHLMHIREQGITAVTWLCYAAIWFYAQNILRNLKSFVSRNTPLWRLIALLYYVVSCQMIERIPYLGEFVNNKSTVQKPSRRKKDECK